MITVYYDDDLWKVLKKDSATYFVKKIREFRKSIKSLFNKKNCGLVFSFHTTCNLLLRHWVSSWAIICLHLKILRHQNENSTKSNVSWTLDFESALSFASHLLFILRYILCKKIILLTSVRTKLRFCWQGLTQ